jgi:hypothetical protein
MPARFIHSRLSSIYFPRSVSVGPVITGASRQMPHREIRSQSMLSARAQTFALQHAQKTPAASRDRGFSETMTGT